MHIFESSTLFRFETFTGMDIQKYKSEKDLPLYALPTGG
jgi:hypothetical protein